MRGKYIRTEEHCNKQRVIMKKLYSENTLLRHRINNSISLAMKDTDIRKKISERTKKAMSKKDIRDRYLVGIKNRKMDKIREVAYKNLWENSETIRRRLEGIKNRRSYKGKGNPSYIDGRTPLVKAIRRLEEYKIWRKEVFQRDGFLCQECFNTRSKKLHAHHIKDFNNIFSEFLREYNQFSPIEDKETLLRLAVNYKPFWDIGNGRTLCIDDHLIIPKKERK